MSNPQDFIERARSICRSVLTSGSLASIHTRFDEIDPSGDLRERWLRTLWTTETLPADARTAIAESAALAPDVAYAGERAVLLHAALRTLERLPSARLHVSSVPLLCRQFEFFANPGEKWLHRFEPATYSYRVYAGMTLFERFPAGRMDWEVSGLPRSWLLKMPKRDLPRVLRSVAADLKGFRPLINMYMAFRQAPMEVFLEKDVSASYLRIVRNLALRPEIKGIMAASWLFSPETHRVCPHLNWTTRIFEQYGAVITDVGPAPPGNGFLTGNNERRALYESGAYKPTKALILWPRSGALEWLARQPEGEP